jgi:hypothetical protein
MDGFMNIKEHAKGLIPFKLLILYGIIINGMIGPAECVNSIVVNGVNDTIM